MRRPAIAATIGSALWLCATLATSPAAAQLAGGPETREVRPNQYLLLSGVAILVASYVPSFVIAATSSRAGDGWLYAPVIGPWVDRGTRDSCVVHGGNCDNELLYRDLLVAAGVTQIVGAVAIISSFIIPEYRLADRSVAQSVKPELRISPMRLARNGYGVGIGGRF